MHVPFRPCPNYSNARTVFNHSTIEYQVFINRKCRRVICRPGVISHVYNQHHIILQKIRYRVIRYAVLFERNKFCSVTFIHFCLEGGARSGA